MNFSKCLDPNDYPNLPQSVEVDTVMSTVGGFRYEHPHRKWEYGLALNLVDTFPESKTFLNIGGGNSPLSYMVNLRGLKVTEVDPNVPTERFDGIEYLDVAFPHKSVGTYDIVMSTSVIEHVVDDIEFFNEMLNHSNYLVFITTDFSIDGSRKSGAHERTYSAKTMKDFIDIGATKGFYPLGNYDYTYHGNFVYDYSFASLAMVKL